MLISTYKHVLVRLIVALGLTLVMPSANAVETRLVAPRPVVWQDFLGVNAHFLWFTPHQYNLQIEKLKALGLNWVRVDLHWDRHEPQEGRFNLQPLDDLTLSLQAQNIKSVFYLVGSAPFASSAPFFVSNKDQYPPRDPQVFAKRMGMFAQRYPSVNAWQVWNEPNLPAFWQPSENATDYSRLLQATVKVLNSVAPQKTVVMAGMAYYSQMPIKKGLMLEEMGKVGALNLGAIAAYHPYSQTPEGDDPNARDFVLRASEVNQRLRGVRIPGIWASEWGWSSYSGPKQEQPIIGESGQADYTLRRLALMSAMDFDRIFLFALSDLDSRASVRDRGYGLLDINGKPKLVYTALSRFFAITGPRINPMEPPVVKNSPDDLYSIAWVKPNGTRLWMFWSAKPRVAKLDGISSATLHQPLNNSKQLLQASASELSVPITPQLQILEWR